MKDGDPEIVQGNYLQSESDLPDYEYTPEEAFARLNSFNPHLRFNNLEEVRVGLKAMATFNHEVTAWMLISLGNKSQKVLSLARHISKLEELTKKNNLKLDIVGMLIRDIQKD